MPMKHGYRTQHATASAQHTLNPTVAKGFNQMSPSARTITVALDMSKSFDTINIHTLIRKLLQTNIPVTIITFIANYIKGRKTYTAYRNHTPRHINLKLAFHKAASFHSHYLTFTPQHLPPPSAPVQVITYADDITIASTHTHARVQSRNIYNYIYRKVFFMD